MKIYEDENISVIKETSEYAVYRNNKIWFRTGIKTNLFGQVTWMYENEILNARMGLGEYAKKYPTTEVAG